MSAEIRPTRVPSAHREGRAARRSFRVIASSILLLTLSACSSSRETAAREPLGSVVRSLALLALNVPTSTVTTDRSPGVSSISQTSRACSSDGLLLRVYPVDEATGQRSLLLQLRNLATHACRLRGYPVVELRPKSGLPLPFRYRDAGDQIVTSRRPRRVILAPASSAFALINKYRCDLGERSIAAQIDVVPRNGQPGLHRRVPRDSELGSCGRGDPGSTVSISPFERTARRTFRPV
jgi:Protein of unknown function (DUF4232)